MCSLLPNPFLKHDAGFLQVIILLCSTEKKDSTAAPVFDLKAGNRGSEIDQIINEMSLGLSLDQEVPTADVNDELMALITNE